MFEGRVPPRPSSSPAKPSAVAPCPSNGTVKIRDVDGKRLAWPVMPVNGAIQHRAVPSCGGGSFAWRAYVISGGKEASAGHLIKLENTASAVVTVRSFGQTTAARGEIHIENAFAWRPVQAAGEKRADRVDGARPSLRAFAVQAMGL